MTMRMNSKARATLICLYVWFFSNGIPCYSIESDIDCLKSVKQSVRDPLNYLSSWNFSSKTEGFICRFAGIECWHPDENKVLNIRLSEMGLEGEFPRGLEKCSSLTGLDLSNNKFHGHILSNISNVLKYVTVIDLSSNRFSGEIPAGLGNCTYLNVLKLDNNNFTGQIPAVIGQLQRMRTFSVANNQLTGPVPVFSNATSVEVNYANNPGLCGGPLPPCRTSH